MTIKLINNFILVANEENRIIPFLFIKQNIYNLYKHDGIIDTSNSDSLMTNSTMTFKITLGRLPAVPLDKFKLILICF